MDDEFKFAQHVANAAYEYEIGAGLGGVAASKSYTHIFNLVMYRDDIERAYGKIEAIYGLTTCAFSQESAEDALRLLDKALGQTSIFA